MINSICSYSETGLFLESISGLTDNLSISIRIVVSVFIALVWLVIVLIVSITLYNQRKKKDDVRKENQVRQNVSIEVLN